MQCKSCAYPLWGITSRLCPECGEPFNPADHDFVANTVRFCCPHCDQDYYGTDARGQLVPHAFACVRCGRGISMAEMVLRPAAGVREEQTRALRFPWLDRERGFFRAWIDTVGLAAFQPARLARALKPESPTLYAWGFAVLSNAVFLTLAVTPFCCLMLFAAGIMGRGGAGGVGGGFVLSTATTAAVVFGAFVLFVAAWGATAHGVLRLTGPTAGGIKRTYQTVLYSSGANAMAAVPCLGLYVSWIWWTVCAIVMLAETQRVRAWRAVLAGALLPLLLILGLLTAYGLFLYSAVSAGAFTAATAPAPVPAGQRARHMLSVLVEHAEDAQDAQYPDHAARLITEDGAAPDDFVLQSSATLPTGIPLAGISLDLLPALPAYKSTAVLAAAAAALPPETIAHRLGDFVFTYHGMDPATADPGLWIVIASPDPESNGAFPSGAPHTTVGRVDGTILEIKPDGLEAALDSQNTLRGAAGLAPLPDPETVLHRRPAVAPGR